MRLTLRTMLAYMDGILDAEDAEDIGRRIEESEQATSLLHRTRDVMRRLRLAAPSLTDRGPGLDPNTVAEYLDNTLHDNRVADFEKVCLDSDVHLAEVAACHQILALVLGEAAEIDPATRERIYGLTSLKTAEAEPQPPPAPDTPSSEEELAADAPTVTTRRKPTVPDYLRDPPKRRRPLLRVAFALVVALGLAVVVLGALGQFESDTPLGGALARLFGADQREEPQPAEPTEESPQPPGPPLSEVPGPELPDPTDPAGPGGPEAPGPESPEPPVTDPDQGPTAEPTEQPGPPPAADQPKPQGEEQPKVVPLPEPPKGLAGLMSEKQVLLRFHPPTGHWHRVPPQGVVTAGEKLLVLPTYRPLLALMSAEVTIQLIDGTQAELLPVDTSGVPGLKADYGRLVMRTVGKPGARIRLQVGNRSGVITFAEAKSVVALEAIPVHIPGSDPEAEPGSLVADVYAITGQVLWDDTEGEPTVPIPEGHWVMLSDQPSQPPTPVKELPKWVTGETMSPLDADRVASPNLERELLVDRSVRFGTRLILMELNDHRRKENRWLATRCLGHIGDFGPLVAVLNDPEHSRVWTDQAIELLREAVARGPDTAAQVRGALERQFTQDATDLYRMLWGYTDSDLKDGGEALRLIESLEDETLAVRTLGYWNLRNIFGLTLQYLPTAPEPTRRACAQKWRDRLESGELWSRVPEEGRTTPEEAPEEKSPAPEPTPPQP